MTALEIPWRELSADALQGVIEERERELANLDVKATVAGTVLPVVDKPERETPDGQLPAWSGSALHPRNRGALLTASDRICQIGDPEKLVAEIIIDQSDVELVRAADAIRARRLAAPADSVSHNGIEPASVHP